MNPNEKEDVPTPRAGGDVIWKSASQAPPAESADENPGTTSSQDSEADKRACGGDVYLKAASQTEEKE